MSIPRTTVLLLALIASNSMAASFDCSKASNFAEKEICRDGYLSGLDSSLSRTYNSALSTFPEQQNVLRQSQREWLADRNTCNTQKCVDQSVSARFKALEDFTTAQVMSSLEATRQKEQARSQAEDAAEDRRKHEAHVAEEEAYQQRLRATQQASAYSQPKNQPSASTASTSQSTYQTSSQQRSVIVTKEETVLEQVGSVAWKCALIVAILSAVWAVMRHRKGKATIYNDYTDAAITNFLPVTGFVIGLICGWLGMPHQVYQITVSTGLILAVFYAVYASFQTNQGPLDILLTIIAKLTFISVFYIIMALMIVSFFAGARRKGESLTQAETRQRRDSRKTRVQIVAASAGYTFFTIWLCRRAEFTPISECLEFEPGPNIA